MSGLLLKSELEVALVMTCSVWSLLWFIIQTVLFIPMWRFRELYWMKSRWTDIDIIGICTLCSAYTLGRPITLWSFYVQKDTQELDLTTNQLILTITAMFFAVGPTAGMCLIMCGRAWNQYYNAMVAVKIGLAEWKQMIDESLITEDVSWFLRHKHTWGNRQFCNRILFCLWFLILVIAALIPVLGIGSDSIMYALLAGFAIIFLTRLAYSYPAFQDTIYLRSEKYNLVVVLVVFGVVWVVTVIILILFEWDKGNHKIILRLNHAFRQIWLGMLGSATMLAIGTLVIKNFINASYSIDLCGLYSIPLTFDIHSGARKLGNQSPSASSRSTSSITESLKQILSEKNEFRAFMAHLFAELSYENALCLIECTKFRQRVIEVMNDELDENDSSMNAVMFCEDVSNTQSSLVNRLTDSGDVRSVALLIAHKYLRNDSAFQINLPFRLVTGVLNQLDDPCSHLNHTLFDSVISECIALLKFSLTRFQREQSS